MHKNEIEILTIRQLLGAGTKYIIPIYQRNYAWGVDEIGQLIQDIIDYALEDNAKSDYYIGTLVVSKENETDAFQTIDGQQRLTTLSILTSALKNSTDIDFSFFEGSNLKYESRERSTSALAKVYHGEVDSGQIDENIISAYEICLKELTNRLSEHHLSIKRFTDYLYDHVKILRVPLSKEIDLNHYFEIMNSRGEQLEKHEILKAQLMSVFIESDQGDTRLLATCFDLIWQSCSEMETYVQYGFSVDRRNIVFDSRSWDALTVSSFDEFVNKLRENLANDADVAESSIDDILMDRPIKSGLVSGSDIPDRFNSVINFPNFLLHVLRVQEIGKDVPLDDKRLLQIFTPYLAQDKQSRLKFVKEFIFNLLQCKLLFDKYIIKREFTGNMDRWSLKSLRKTEFSGGNSAAYTSTFPSENVDPLNSDNRKILMILSMFHVSNPSMTYKYWLNAALTYLFQQFEVQSENYIAYLEHIAKAFVFDRFLANEAEIVKGEYADMIQNNLHPINRETGALDNKKTTYHNIQNNLVFNFLDYLIWLKPRSEGSDTRIRSFEFTFRSSVEHYYPQTAYNEQIDVLEQDVLHSFGNLCLISNEKNSKLRNFSPAAKNDFYGNKGPIDSLKQFLMMSEKKWNAKSIAVHQQAMIELLQDNMSSEYRPIQRVSLAVSRMKQYRVSDPVLLARALFCFGDTSKLISGDKYNFLAFDYARNTDEFLKFERFIEEHPGINLHQAIAHRLLDKELLKSWRYPFIKYPDLMTYCVDGNFLWENEGKKITLLRAQKRGANTSKPLYNFLIESYLSKLLGVTLWSDSTKVHLHINYVDDHYKFVNFGEDHSFILAIRETAGDAIDVRLYSKVNGNSTQSKRLVEYGWKKSDSRTFLRPDGEVLCETSENVYANIVRIESNLRKLLIKGFGMKIPKS